MNEKQLKKFLYSLKKKGVINDEVYKRVYPKGSEPARMYGNPKIHKLTKDEIGNKVLPSLRPINSSMSSFNYKLANYLSELLNAVILTDHCATDIVRDISMTPNFTFNSFIFVFNSVYCDISD